MDVLLVDDSPTMLLRLQLFLEVEHGVTVTANADPVAALMEARTCAFDLVLVDQHMPRMEGIEFVSEIRTIPHYEQAPVAMITSDVSDIIRQKAFKVGVTDFIDKGSNEIELKMRLRNLVRLASAVRRLDEQATSMAGEIERALRQLRDTEAEVICRLALAVEYRDNDTGEHTWRVARYSQIIAETMNLPDDFCRRLYLAAPLHDVGKVAVPDKILLKSGRLDESEFAVIRTHPIVGKKILGESRSKLICLAAEIAEAHHEKWNGSGYPYGLVGEAIPLSARIVAVADVFDALTTERPYKKAMAMEAALGCLQADSGSHFDPACIKAFEAAWEEIVTVRATVSGIRTKSIVCTTEPWARVPELRREVMECAD